MSEMRDKWLKNVLSDEQKKSASKMIRYTQKLLADCSLEVIGVDKGNITLEESSTLLSEAKEKITSEQGKKIKEYGVNAQAI